MARLMLQELIGPAAVGVLSSGGNLIEENRLEKKTTQGLPANMILDNAGMITDAGIAVLTIVNHMLPQPVVRQGSSELMAAGIAIGIRRVGDVLGRNVLGLQRVITKTTPGRRAMNPGGHAAGSFPVYSPNAALEAPITTQKRQFFSIT